MTLANGSPAPSTICFRFVARSCRCLVPPRCIGCGDREPMPAANARAPRGAGFSPGNLMGVARRFGRTSTTPARSELYLPSGEPRDQRLPFVTTACRITVNIATPQQELLRCFVPTDQNYVDSPRKQYASLFDTNGSTIFRSIRSSSKWSFCSIFTRRSGPNCTCQYRIVPRLRVELNFAATCAILLPRLTR